MSITKDQLLAIFPNAAEPERRAAAVSAAWAEFGYSNPNEWAGMLAVVGNETGGYRHAKAREDMTYSPGRAVAAFGSIRAQKCIALCPIDDKRNVVRTDRGQAFGNCIYAYMIGNGGPETGDGWKYRGGFDPQLTGRANYQACSNALGVDLMTDPDQYTGDFEVSARVAAWFMGPYAKCKPLFATGREDDFLRGAGIVGHPPPGATETRLRFWYKARQVLGAAVGARLPMLQIGDEGADVLALQRALNQPEPVSFAAMLIEDGKFGSTTHLAVRHFQSLRGLVVDGIAGEKTLAALGLK